MGPNQRCQFPDIAGRTHTPHYRCVWLKSQANRSVVMDGWMDGGGVMGFGVEGFKL